MSQCSTFPGAMLGLQYFRFVKLLVNLIQPGIFMTTLLLKGCIVSIKCFISCVCIIKYWLELRQFFHQSSDDYKFWEIKKEIGHRSRFYTQLAPKVLLKNISGSFYKDKVLNCFLLQVIFWIVASFILHWMLKCHSII